jgi:hypothetical protein
VQAHARIAATIAIAGLLALAALVPTAGAGDSKTGKTTGCSSFGTVWAHSYNQHAVVAGNPVRILDACCQPSNKAGINHCFVTVTLVGTRDRGCESVDIGRNGLPAGQGKHEVCKHIA